MTTADRIIAVLREHGAAVVWYEVSALDVHCCPDIVAAWKTAA